MTDDALRPPYDAPPIIEAVVQIRFAEAVSSTFQSKLLKRLKREYANDVALQAVEASVDFEKRETEFVAEPQSRLSSSDETDILVVHPTIMTWSRLAPYQGWAHISERVKRDIQIALEITGWRKFSQLGVRYVNRIDIPVTPIIRYEDYLTINLSLPKCWETINNYGWRLERIYSDLSSLAIVQSAVITPEIPDHAAFLLDIDIIRKQDIPTKVEDIFLLFEKMRDLKNDIFELSITDTARASFAR